MRERHDGTERDGVAHRAATADEVGGDQRLAVPGRQRMQPAQYPGQRQRQQQQPRESVGA